MSAIKPEVTQNTSETTKTKTFKTRIKQRRDTSANWESKNPVLLNGEVIIVDTANGETRTKTGDGTKTYTQLPFDDEGTKGGKSLIDKSFADKVSTNGNTTTIDNQLKTYSITTRLEADVAITGLDENGQEVIKHKLSEKANSSEVNNKVDKVPGKSLVDAQDIRTAIESDSLTFTGEQKVKLRAEASDETCMTTIDANGVTIATPTQEVALTDSSIMVSNNSGEGITINPQEVVIKDAQGQKIHSLSEKVNKSDVLTKTNTTEFTPTADYQPATKKYVDNNKLSHIANGETIGTIKIGRTGSQRTDGPYSTAIGFSGHTSADALNSIAMCGGECLASDTVAMGNGTVANGADQFVQGKYNVKDTENKYAHIIGNGTSDTARSNAHTVDWNGNAWFAGDIEGVKDGTTHKLSEKANASDLAKKVGTGDNYNPNASAANVINLSGLTKEQYDSGEYTEGSSGAERICGIKFDTGTETKKAQITIGSDGGTITALSCSYDSIVGTQNGYDMFGISSNDIWCGDTTYSTMPGEVHYLKKKWEGKTYTISVPITDWTEKTDSENQKYYYKKITVSNMTAYGQAMTDVSMSEDVAVARKQIEAYQCINRVVTGEGYVELYCFDEIPTTAFTLRVLVIGNWLG